MKKIVTYSFILAIISSLFLSCTKPDGEGVLPPEPYFECYAVFKNSDNIDQMNNIPLGILNEDSKLEVIASFASKEEMTFEILDTRTKTLPINMDDLENRYYWFVYNENQEQDYRVLKCALGRPSNWLLDEDNQYLELKIASYEIFNDNEIHILQIPIEYSEGEGLLGKITLFDGIEQETKRATYGIKYFYFIKLDD